MGILNQLRCFQKDLRIFDVLADLFPQVLAGVDPLKVIIAVELI